MGASRIRNGKEHPACTIAYHSAQELSRSPGRKDRREVRGQNGAKINGQTIEQSQRIGTVTRVDLGMNDVGKCIVDNRPETQGLFPAGTAGQKAGRMLMLRHKDSDARPVNDSDV
jgi:hypothetical protein